MYAFTYGNPAASRGFFFFLFLFPFEAAARALHLRPRQPACQQDALSDTRNLCTPPVLELSPAVPRVTSLHGVQNRLGRAFGLRSGLCRGPAPTHAPMLGWHVGVLQENQSIHATAQLTPAERNYARQWPHQTAAAGTIMDGFMAMALPHWATPTPAAAPGSANAARLISAHVQTGDPSESRASSASLRFLLGAFGWPHDYS